MWNYSINPIHMNVFLTRIFHDRFPTFQSLHLNSQKCTGILYFYPTTEISTDLWKRTTGIQSMTWETDNEVLKGVFQFVRIESQYYELLSVQERETISISKEDYESRSFQFPIPSLSSFSITMMLEQFQDYHHWIATDQETSQDFSILLYPPNHRHTHCWKCQKTFTKGLCVWFQREEKKEDLNIPPFQLCKPCCSRLLF